MLRCPLRGQPESRWRRFSSWHFEQRLSLQLPPDHDSRATGWSPNLANLDSKWTPRDLFRDVEERKHFRKSMFCWALFWWTW